MCWLNECLNFIYLFIFFFENLWKVFDDHLNGLDLGYQRLIKFGLKTFVFFRQSSHWCPNTLMLDFMQGFRARLVTVFKEESVLIFCDYVENPCLVNVRNLQQEILAYSFPTIHGVKPPHIAQQKSAHMWKGRELQWVYEYLVFFSIFWFFFNPNIKIWSVNRVYKANNGCYIKIQPFNFHRFRDICENVPNIWS